MSTEFKVGDFERVSAMSPQSDYFGTEDLLAQAYEDFVLGGSAAVLKPEVEVRDED